MRGKQERVLASPFRGRLGQDEPIAREGRHRRQIAPELRVAASEEVGVHVGVHQVPRDAVATGHGLGAPPLSLAQRSIISVRASQCHAPRARQCV